MALSYRFGSAPEKRRDLVHRAVKLLQDEAHVIPLHRQVIPWASRTNVSVVHMPNNWLVPVWVKIK